jgi:uncharacterized protein (TIGR02996 family)
MTRDEKALLAAICGEPEEDTPRLAYADWLDETGDPVKSARAEFIRLCCELSSIAQSVPAHHESEEYQAKSKRADQLAAEHYRVWLRPLFNIPKLKWPARVFWWHMYDRGFISYVEFPNAKAFHQYGSRVFAKTPIRSVRFGRLTPRTAPRVLASPLFRSVAELDLGHLIEGTIAQLQGPQNEIGTAGAVALAGNPNLTRLDRLRLAGARISDAGLEALSRAADAGRLPRVRDLDLAGNELTAAGLRVLIESRLGRVTRLDLGNNPLGEDAAVILGREPLPAGLKVLDLGYTRLGDSGVRVLFRQPLPAGLRHLNLGANAITDAGVRSIVRHDPPAALDTLNMATNRITPGGAERLLTWCREFKVRAVYLDGNDIPDGDRVRLRGLFGGCVTF